jgi:hypothetical protein
MPAIKFKIIKLSDYQIPESENLKLAPSHSKFENLKI